MVNESATLPVSVRVVLSELSKLCRAAVNAPTFPIPTLRRLEFDKEFVPERRSVVVHSDRYLGAKAASQEAIVLKPRV
jgi:hypothetical protein